MYVPPTHTHSHHAAMAGNIIPAIATTNAVIAGLIVMEALKVLAGESHKCKTVSISISCTKEYMVCLRAIAIEVCTYIESIPYSGNIWRMSHLNVIGGF